jgi:hypothetical protein
MELVLLLLHEVIWSSRAIRIRALQQKTQVGESDTAEPIDT